MDLEPVDLQRPQRVQRLLDFRHDSGLAAGAHIAGGEDELKRLELVGASPPSRCQQRSQLCVWYLYCLKARVEREGL
jgi:hypothetical protein